MAKTPAEIRSLARGHTETAVNVLVGIMNEPKSPAQARITAAQTLLDRGWGKATQVVAGDEDGGPVALIHRIERVIKNAGNTDS